MNARLEWLVSAAPGLGMLGQSERVRSLQISMNVDNTCIGSPRAAIPEDGLPGATTCAMAQFLNTKTGTPYNPECGAGAVRSYPSDELCPCPPGQIRNPRTGKCAAAPPPPPPEPEPVPPPPPPPPTAAKASGGGGLIAAVIATLAVVGIAIAGRS